MIDFGLTCQKSTRKSIFAKIIFVMLVGNKRANSNAQDQYTLIKQSIFKHKLFDTIITGASLSEPHNFMYVYIM